MNEQNINFYEGNNLILSDNLSSEEKSSGTEGSYFEEEDKNLIEKVVNIKKDVINNKISFTNKFEFIKNSNFLYNFYCGNFNCILLINIISISIFLMAFIIKLIFKLFLNGKTDISNYFIILISIMLLPFLICTLIKMIIIHKNLESKDDDNENKDLVRLVTQVWNIYYSLSLFLLTTNFIMRLIVIDILHYHYKIVLFLDILIILLSLIIFGIIYYLTKTSSNILITNVLDNISFPLSISVLFAFIIIIFTEQIKSLLYDSPIYVFLLTCLSLLFMVYYDDILYSFFIFIYQLGGIKNISFYNMNFHTFCTLINLVFIIFMTFKTIRKYFFSQPDENVYCLVNEETMDTNEDGSSDE